MKQLSDKLFQDLLNLISDARQTSYTNAQVFATVQEALKLPTLPEEKPEK